MSAATDTAAARQTAPLMRATDLQKRFGRTLAVKGVSFDVRQGECLSIVGESGCGKTTTARMLMALEPPSGGTIELDGRAQADWLKHDAYAYRRRIQYVFQDPVMSLNPRKTVAQLLDTPLRTLTDKDRTARQARIEELMRLVGLRPEFIDRYPHQFSGGQCQRIGIARALATEPDILVLDEPVSALDVSIQAQILNLLRELQKRLNLTYIFISHDLAVVEILSDRLLVMLDGEVVEQGSREQVFGAPRSEYTKKLLGSVPRL